ncbi:hypothetical protein BO83DRAFT_404054 [Aspergillus eucalypticola CBS 122712]|uniref:Uncharacterized protein n=1 Tax=Aspergillus eucalypticola (strain CBS 122712 / IBT 29274) TaxID=1448314 RepID=A0A317UJ70_ASPEC|nr:uncharacterized protein BO83DRAFT_404054 [Aspergillus eucalypticola CBS 122712]PWY62123.1 hypothetical protein BO83DRAFT_404054 [Aspergillus eucalypticola CBS 122712]
MCQPHLNLRAAQHMQIGTSVKKYGKISKPNANPHNTHLHLSHETSKGNAIGSYVQHITGIPQMVRNAEVEPRT